MMTAAVIRLMHNSQACVFTMVFRSVMVKQSGFEGFLAFLKHDQGLLGAGLPGGFLFGGADPIAVALLI